MTMNRNHIVSSMSDFSIEPSCCDDFKEFIFVANTEISDKGSLKNSCYIFPLTIDNKPYNSDGVLLRYCPWCGEEIKILKKEPKF